MLNMTCYITIEDQKYIIYIYIYIFIYITENRIVLQIAMKIVCLDKNI